MAQPIRETPVLTGEEGLFNGFAFCDDFYVMFPRYKCEIVRELHLVI